MKKTASRAKKLTKLKRIAKRTDGTVFQHIGASKGSGHHKRMPGTFGAASPVRYIDPKTGEEISAR